jgi:hypothetical protein
MAYLEKINQACRYIGCKSRATHVLRNRWNAELGKYCTKHGQKRLRELQKEEEQAYAREAVATRHV